MLLSLSSAAAPGLRKARLGKVLVTPNTWESIFDKQGQANDLLLIYDEISHKYRVD